MDYPECGALLSLDIEDSWNYVGFCPECKEEYDIILELREEEKFYFEGDPRDDGSECEHNKPFYECEICGNVRREMPKYDK